MWVRSHLAELEEQGVIERVTSAKFASNIVLVDEGQSG
jgi:predicted ArsR family transcriptional regulator